MANPSLLSDRRLRALRDRPVISLKRLLLITIGAFLGALSVVVFLAPSEIAPGGVSGVAIILNAAIGTPLGIVILILNIPIMIIGYRMLGGWRIVAGTVYAVVSVSLMIEAMEIYFTDPAVSEDALLNAVFGGIVGGLSGGLIYRAGATAGGTATLGRILQQRFGIPIASATLYTDSVVVLVAGVVFGWEAAMYAIISLFTYGAVTDYVLEGPSVIRTATIITAHPRDVANMLITELGRGVTAWEAQGMYTGQFKTVLFVTVVRSQVSLVRELVAGVDPDAFIVIGQGHVAYGRGFKRVSMVQRRTVTLAPPNSELPTIIDDSAE